jgi:hypothetical protein
MACSLPNRYQVMMIDVTDQGWVYNPMTQPGSGVGEREDAIAGVRNVQVAGRYILGATESRAFENLGKDTNQVDAYFLLDTKLGRRTRFQNYDALRHGALELGIEPNLEPINAVYSKFRFSWLTHCPDCCFASRHSSVLSCLLCGSRGCDERDRCYLIPLERYLDTPNCRE